MIQGDEDPEAALVFQVGSNLDWRGSYVATRHSLRKEVILTLYSEGPKDFEELVLKTDSAPTELSGHLKALRPLVIIDNLSGEYTLSEAGSRVANLLLLEEALMTLGRLTVSERERKIKA